MLLQGAPLPESLVAVGALLRHHIAVEPEVSGVALLLERQAADGAVGHPGHHAKVVEHVPHQGLVVLEGPVAEGAEEAVKVVATRHN